MFSVQGMRLRVSADVDMYVYRSYFAILYIVKTMAGY